MRVSQCGSCEHRRSAVVGVARAERGRCGGVGGGARRGARAGRGGRTWDGSGSKYYGGYGGRTYCENCIELPEPARRNFERMRRRLDRLEKSLAEIKSQQS